MKINQFVSGLEYGDAVSNDVIELQRFLQDLGHESEIYAVAAEDYYVGKYKHIKEYQGDKDAILIVHHSMFLYEYDYVMSLPDRKIMRYHNITPAKFFKFRPEISKYILDGTKQIHTARDEFITAFTDSRYNGIELRKMGYLSVRELPIVINFNKYDVYEQTDGSKQLAQRLQQNDLNVVCLGRVVKNKNQYIIAQAFAEFLAQTNINAKLFLIGNTQQQMGYVNKIRKFIEDNGLQDKIIFTNKITDEELSTYLKYSQVMVSYSDHEGFGVPLVEAMHIGMSIIAKQTSALPYTLGGHGLLVKDKSELTAALTQLASNKDYFHGIVAQQKERLQHFTTANVKKRLHQLLDEVMVGPRKPLVKLVDDSAQNLDLILQMYRSDQFDLLLEDDNAKEPIDLNNPDNVDYLYLLQKSLRTQAAQLDILLNLNDTDRPLSGKYKALYANQPINLTADINDKFDCVFIDSALKIDTTAVTIPVYLVEQANLNEQVSKALIDLDSQLAIKRIALVGPYGNGTPLANQIEQANSAKTANLEFQVYTDNPGLRQTNVLFCWIAQQKLDTLLQTLLINSPDVVNIYVDDGLYDTQQLMNLIMKLRRHQIPVRIIAYAAAPLLDSQVLAACINEQQITVYCNEAVANTLVNVIAAELIKPQAEQFIL